MAAPRRPRPRFVAAFLVTCALVVAPGNASAERSAVTTARDTRPRLGRTMATVRIPAIDLDVQLIYGIHDNALARGLGLWPGTAIPGRPGNAVVAGHRTSHGAPLRDIDKLKIGDRIYVTSGGKAPSALEYRITKRQIVRPDAMWITRSTKASTLTIFACHPPHSIAYRYVIFARLVGTPMAGST